MTNLMPKKINEEWTIEFTCKERHYEAVASLSKTNERKVSQILSPDDICYAKIRTLLAFLCNVCT